MASDQKSLFDMNLAMVDAPASEEFIDENRKRLNEMTWQSLSRHGFMYDEDADLKFTHIQMALRCDRRLKKNGKIEYLLLRSYSYETIDDLIEDEIPCDKIEELEKSFQNEIGLFEQERLLPADVLFDGHRYCWKFEKLADGRVEFTERWYPDIPDESSEENESDNEILSVNDEIFDEGPDFEDGDDDAVLSECV